MDSPQKISILVTSHKQLEFYRRAYAISLQLHGFCEHFPKHEQYGLADQIRRASRGVCANIAEGFARGRASGAEFKRFLQIALSSCAEMDVWLDYCRDLNYIDSSDTEKLRNEYSEITKMMASFKNKIGI